VTARIVRLGLMALVCASGLGVSAGIAAGMVAAAPGDPSVPSPTDPVAPPPSIVTGNPSALVPVPIGCPQPEPAAVTFVGTMTGKDDVTKVVRFRIDQLRAGSAEPWAIDGLIDIRYGDDYRFLVKGDQYLIGAGSDPVYGVLSSTVRPAEPNFGGNDVVGVDDIAVSCPRLDDPVRTLNVDGTSVDSGVLSLMTDDRRLLLATIAVPAALVFAALLALVVLRMFGRLAVAGVWRLGRASVTPVADHRAVRVRSHRAVDVASDEPIDEPAARIGGRP
jgi:hypothetical protein